MGSTSSKKDNGQSVLHYCFRYKWQEVFRYIQPIKHDWMLILLYSGTYLTHTLAWTLFYSTWRRWYCLTLKLCLRNNIFVSCLCLAFVFLLPLSSSLSLPLSLPVFVFCLFVSEGGSALICHVLSIYSCVFFIRHGAK